MSQSTKYQGVDASMLAMWPHMDVRSKLCLLYAYVRNTCPGWDIPQKMLTVMAKLPDPKIALDKVDAMRVQRRKRTAAKRKSRKNKTQQVKDLERSLEDAQKARDAALRERDLARRERDRMDSREKVKRLQRERDNAVKEVEDMRAQMEEMRKRMQALEVDKEGLESAVEKLEDEKEVLDAQIKCDICFSADKTHACFPCGHLCVCAGCMPKINECPHCRQRVRRGKKGQGWRRVYI